MPHILPRNTQYLLIITLFLTTCTPVQLVPRSITPAPFVAPGIIEITEGVISPSSVAIISTPTNPMSCTSRTGVINKGVINTPLLDKPMRYSVYLPPCYAFDTKSRYPVLYLLHGQGFTEEQWERIGATSAADRLINSGDMPPFIMVFPFDYSYKQPTEYKFEEVFIHLLLPSVDSTYRTSPTASHRAIGGLSRGGAWALRIGLRNPDLFSAIGGHSPAIFFVDEKSLRRRLLEIPSAKMPRIWLDIGESDSDYTVVLPLEEFLSTHNIPHEWHTYVGWHDEKYWSAHVARYLSWYSQAWR